MFKISVVDDNVSVTRSTPSQDSDAMHRARALVVH